ncbi:chloride channel protein [Azospirillum picis]|uniref:CIC family chloride channel protein n=1 Tax=Azospirillum picis TaxID=488438 RepID=A0ABU0MTX6_9PROT|nr:chloride channel protein [Azospirillum picis]MBP2303168.1 CIC family chloride channel protein [Azospirillum picis]MDQ0536920.1 CIC family chloride channel protein [Azospirillum picis]
MPDNSVPIDGVGENAQAGTDPYSALDASAATTLSDRWSVRDSALAVVGLAALVGGTVGLLVGLLHEGVLMLQALAFDLPDGERLGQSAPDLLRTLGVPVAGGLLLGVLSALVRRWRPNDIVDAVEANALYGGKMSLIDSLRLTVTTALSNGSGASVGMEAAYTQAGAGLASTLGQRLRLRRADLRTMVGCGAAAAIAAAYHAPLAGAFYAFELVLGGYTLAALAPVGAAAVLAVAASGLLTGGEVPLALGRPVVIAGWDYAACGVIGFLAGWLSILAMQAVTAAERGFKRLPIPRWMRPAVGGLAFGGVALAVPAVMGSGPGAVPPELAGGALALALTLVAKILASALSLGSGFRGGLFSASLFIGGLFGGLLGIATDGLLPQLGIDSGLLLLVGMGSVAAGIVGAPVTMVLLVLETTQDLWAASGVLIGVVLSTTVVRQAFGYSFATWRFHLRGVPIRGAYDIGWLSELTAFRLMRRDAKTVPATLTVQALRRLYPLGAAKLVFAVDEKGTYAGMVDMAAVHDPDQDATATETRVADLATKADAVLMPGDDARTVLGRFGSAESETLPVLSSPTDRRVIGYVTESFALRRYSQALERQRGEDLGERGLWGRD